MSWEALVIGSFIFRDEVNEAAKKTIIKKLESVIECHVEYLETLHAYVCEDVNWSSHVSEDKIEEFVKKYAEYLRYFSYSLYYLSGPHYSGEYELDQLEKLAKKKKTKKIELKNNFKQKQSKRR